MYHAKYVSLPNLIADQPLVAEMLQDQAEPERLGRALGELLESKQEPVQQRFAQLSRQLRANCQHPGDTIHALLTQ